MELIETATGNKVEAIIEPVLLGDYKIIKKSKRFPDFNWDKEKRNEVLKIRLRDSDEILGLMSLVDFKPEFWIKINLLQSSVGNIGADKEYDRIAGCLIAHACKEAFKRGYFGCVALEPKTELADYYREKYGMEGRGIHLSTELKNSQDIITEYLS